MLSDSQLSVLSYSMQEEVYYRGQTVYREGVHQVDKIYLIRTGDFQLSKFLIKKVDPFNPGDILRVQPDGAQQCLTDRYNDAGKQEGGLTPRDPYQVGPMTGRGGTSNSLISAKQTA